MLDMLLAISLSGIMELAQRNRNMVIIAMVGVSALILVLLIAYLLFSKPDDDDEDEENFEPKPDKQFEREAKRAEKRRAKEAKRRAKLAAKGKGGNKDKDEGEGEGEGEGEEAVDTPDRKASKKADKKAGKAGKKAGKAAAGTATLMGETDYRLISERILRIGGKERTVLFAAAGLDCLPITVVVNTAIELAREGQRCVLVDLDLKRDAIAMAFDIAEEPNRRDFTPRLRNTAFENLMVWPAHNFKLTRHLNIGPLTEAAVAKFDYVLINAPYLDGHVDRRQIASVAKYGFIFTNDPRQAARLAELFKDTECKLVGNIQIDPDAAS
ncbi:MAG: hypothetical protein KAT00_08130 [Planctomycetes bacterium]|nr:hypothetical protein [Planctomycetota bacterium]